MTNLDIETTRGRVTGRQHAGCRQWLGIPYAAATDGEQRWQPPRAHAGWSGAHDATQFGACALQHPSPMGAQIPGGIEAASEDCLSLNVFAPQASPTPRPVMVWIHGGGFAVGASSQALYNGATLAAEHGVVVVTLNYRLGVLGFLRLVDATQGRVAATGNEGLLDQIHALHWVADNIAAFGGDPDNVTLFGESAGAMSVASLVSMPAARGLAHRAILQSGSAHAVHSVERANKVAELFLRELPKRFRDNPLRADHDALKAAALTLHGRMMFDERLSIMPVRPVADDRHLTARPIDIMRAGNAATMPIIIGCNRDEWRYFAQVDRGMRGMRHDALLARLRYYFSRDQIDSALAAYDYRPDQADDAFRVYSAIMGDAAFIEPSWRAAEALASRQPVYRYRFDEAAPGLGGALGACHVVELPYVFGSFDAPGAGVLFSDDARARSVAQAIQQRWTHFAVDGTPGDAAWATHGERPGALRLSGDGLRYLEAGNDARRAFWDTISDDFLQSV